MKSIRILLCVVGGVSFVTFNTNAQITARRLTQKVADANAKQNQSINQALNQSAPTPPSASVPAVVPNVTTPAPQAPANVVPIKTEGQKKAIVEKTIQFQMKRAEAGAPTAQYDLGMRYLKGDGLEKNPKLAQKWLNSAATNGNTQAIKKLKELRHP